MRLFRRVKRGWVCRNKAVCCTKGCMSDVSHFCCVRCSTGSLITVSWRRRVALQSQRFSLKSPVMAYSHAAPSARYEGGVQRISSVYRNDPTHAADVRFTKTIQRIVQYLSNRVFARQVYPTDIKRRHSCHKSDAP